MMSKRIPKILLFALSFCVMFAASGATVFAQCDGVYFKPTTHKVFAEKVQILNYQQDLTGDGKIDLIASFRDSSTNLYSKIYIYPGDGAGNFGAPIQIAVPSPTDYPYIRVRIADFNSDGKNDFLLQASTNPPTVIVYQNNGSGNFTPLTPTVFPSDEGIVNLVDINGDGRVDLLSERVTQSPHIPFYRLANADGSFGASVQLSAAEYGFAGDFNGDSKVDFPVIVNQGGNSFLQIYQNIGNSVFALSSSSTQINNSAVFLEAVKDFNNDGKPDLLFADLGSQGAYFVQSKLIAMINLGGGNFSRVELPVSNPTFQVSVNDFNGDGFSDILTINAIDKHYEIYTSNGTGGFARRIYSRAVPGVVAGDLDGDNKADFIQLNNFDLNSGVAFSPRIFPDETQFAVLKNICAPFGQTKIVDFDGDGLTDTAFWRENGGRWRYQTRKSPSQTVTFNWGTTGDIPVPGDYDADGKTDIAVYRPSSGVWYVVNSSDGSYFGLSFGVSEDRPVAADYNGDGRTDFAVYRPSTGTWYILSGGTFQFSAIRFGASEDKPVPEDYDGDGKTDVAVFRPSNGVWYVLKSSDGTYFGTAWGTNTDVTAPADYDGDGRADLTVMRSGATNTWYILRANNGQLRALSFGTTGDIAQASDWDATGIWDVGVHRPSSSFWFASPYREGLADFGAAAGEIPISSLNKSY